MKLRIEDNFVSTRLGHAIRQKRGISTSLRTLASQLGTSASTICRIERGVGLPEPQLFVRLMVWLNTNKNQYSDYLDRNKY